MVSGAIVVDDRQRRPCMKKDFALPGLWEGENKEEALQRCTFVTYQRMAVSRLELQLVSDACDGARGCRDSMTCAVLGQHFFARVEVA